MDRNRYYERDQRARRDHRRDARDDRDRGYERPQGYGLHSSDDRPATQRVRSQPDRGSSMRVFWIMTAAIIASVALYRFQSERAVAVPPSPKKLSNLSLHEAHNYAAVVGVLGGAKASDEALAHDRHLAPGETTDGPTVHVSTRLASELRTDPTVEVMPATGKWSTAAIRLQGAPGSGLSREDAIANAVRSTRDRLAEVLLGLEPPIRRVPSEAQISKDYVVAESVREVTPSPEMKERWAASGLEKNRQMVTVDIELSVDQLRELYSQQRLFSAGWASGIVLVGLLVLPGLVRLSRLASRPRAVTVS